jgi:hypothetical protein
MQLIRCGRRTSRILGSTRLDPRSMLAFIIAKCELSEVTVLHSCCSISLPGLGSGNVSLRHRLTAEQKLRGSLWKYLSLGDVQGQGRAAPTTYCNSTVFLHFDNWPRISGKAASRAQPDRTAQSFKCSLESLAFKFCIHLHAVSRGSENRNAVSFCKQNARN